MRLIFYTKLECHLCQEAYQMLLDIAWDIPLEIDVIDVSQGHNQDIAADYLERVPVLKRPDTQQELGWPFTPDEVRAFLAR